MKLRWRGQSGKVTANGAARAFYRAPTVSLRNDVIFFRANAREYLFCQVIGNFGSGTV
jgi:hypothetical protein